MKIFKDKQTLQKEIFKDKGISFVPTMGGLHKGHISLIKRSKKSKFKTLVSIYVNPKQFNNKSDFISYPRNIGKDINLLKKLNVSYLYIPTFEDIYGFKTKNKIFLDNFSKKLCGKFRKGHFEGVLNVVNRFIEIINPKNIYFGKKDYQQLYLIKKHIKRNKIKTKVFSCKTIRDKHFIAYSSRLNKLNYVEKIKLIKVIKFLKRYKKNLLSKKLKFNFNVIKKKIVSMGINKVDYIKLIDLKTLKKPRKNKFNLFYAFYIGKVRIIDNF